MTNESINIMREARRSRRKTLFIALCVVLACLLFFWIPNTQASYSKADSASHVFLLAEGQDAQVDLTESAWSVNKGLDQLPGSTLAKNPTVENRGADCYMRVNLRITDKETGEIGSEDAASATIDPTSSAEAKERCSEILKMIWYDGGKNLDEGVGYSSTELATFAGASGVFNSASFEPEFPNTDSTLNGWNSEMKAYSFLYKNENTENVFKAGDTATLFSHIVVPTDITREKFYLAGDYYINVWVQVVQLSDNFTNRDDAIAYLNNSNVENDMTNIDGEEVSSSSGHRSA